MATTEDIRSLLQQQATQRINPFMRGLSILTGGLAGEFTGTNEDIRNRELAKRALMEQNIKELEEERAIKRRMMENTLNLKTSAVSQGLPIPSGETAEEVLNQVMQAQKLQNIGKVAALTASLGRTPQGMPLLANRQDPAFQSGFSATQRDILEKESEAAVQESISRTKTAERIRGFGGTPIPDASAGQLEGQLENLRMKAQSQAPLETSGIRAKAQLRTLQGMGFVPAPIDIDSMSDAEAIANAEIYGRQQQQNDYIGAAQRAAKANTQALRIFNQLLATPNVDKNTLQEAYYNLGENEQKNEEFRMLAQIPRSATQKENDSLDSYISSIGKASSLAKSMYELAADGEISKVSKANFNGFKSWFRGLQNTYGVEDAKLRSINNVIQEFQNLIAEQRKDFFGASLTNNELETAKELFGDPKQANFLPRVIALVDSIMSKDEIQNKYERKGIYINPATKKDVEDARKGWGEIKKQYNFISLGTKGKIRQVVPAGGTNVMDTIKIDSIEEIP